MLSRHSLTVATIVLATGALVACSSTSSGDGPTSVPSNASSDPSSSSTSTTTTTVPAVVTAPIPVEERSLTFVDESRPTKANRSAPALPSRTLPVLLITPSVPNEGGYPLVVFAHGFTANGPVYTPVLRGIAARGYTVAAPTFPLSNGRAVGGPNATDFVSQPGDVSFVIDALLDDESAAAAIDPERIAVAGHSLGGLTTFGVTFNSCCRDDRIDAAIPIAGSTARFGPGTEYEWEPVPVLMIHGDRDRTVAYRNTTGAFALAVPPKFQLTLLGAPHTPFGPPWGAVVNATTVDFLDLYLKGDDAALDRLIVDGNVPGVAALVADPGPGS